MMKTIILQFFHKDNDLGAPKESMYQKAMPTVERYAKKYGYDYELVTEKFLPDWDAQWSPFEVLETDRWDAYDRIIVLDSDVFITEDAPDVFAKYTKFSACREVDNPLPPSRPEFQRWGNEYFNSGVVVYTRHSIRMVRAFDVEGTRIAWRNVRPGRDQMALNLLFDQSNGGYHRIDRKDVCFLREHDLYEAPVVHVAGRCRAIYNDNISYWDEKFGVK